MNPQTALQTVSPSLHHIRGTIVGGSRVGLRLMAILARFGFEPQEFSTWQSSEDARLRQMRLCVEGDAAQLPRTLKQLARLVDVVEVGLEHVDGP